MLCACWICVICRGLGTIFLLRPSSGLRHKHVEWLLYLIQVETQVFTWFACRRSGENVSENSAKPFPMVPALVIVRFTEGASVLKKNPNLRTTVSLFADALPSNSICPQLFWNVTLKLCENVLSLTTQQKGIRITFVFVNAFLTGLLEKVNAAIRD